MSNEIEEIEHYGKICVTNNNETTTIELEGNAEALMRCAVAGVTRFVEVLDEDEDEKLSINDKLQVVNDMFGYVIQDILTPYGDNKDTEDTNESEVE